MYRAGVEGILGLRRAGDELVVDPRLPAAWPGFEATVTFGSTRYEIVVRNRADRTGWDAELNGAPHPAIDGALRVPLDGGRHQLMVSARAAAARTEAGGA
jgi:cyclic beta-1,2-glucan synthetase